MARDFSLESARATARGTVVVRYSCLPLAVSPGGTRDALNPQNYAVRGPGARRVQVVREDLADLASFELLLDRPVTSGEWTVAVSGVETAFGETLSTSEATFSASALLAPVGRPQVPAGYEAFRRMLNPALVGGAWEALAKALGWSLQKTVDLARFVVDQAFLHTAVGRWLTKRAREVAGLERPYLVGLADAPFLQLAEALVGGRLTLTGLWSLVDVFYGPDGTRALAVAETPEPYALVDGDDLALEVGGQRVDLVFDGDDLESAGAASAASVAAALTFYAERRGWAFYADVVQVDGASRVRVVSRAVGLGARLRFLGGRAQRVLRFPERVVVYDGVGTLPTWTVATVPLDAAVTFTTATTPTGSDLSLVQPGDYACVYGTEFSAANRGTYTVLDVQVTLAAGILTQVVKLANPTGAAQGPTAQLADGSFLFFRPDVVRQAPDGPVLTGANNHLLLGELPVSTLVVLRTPATAAYLRDWVLQGNTAQYRRNGFTTISIPSHLLQGGDQLELRGAVPSLSKPPTVAAGAGLAAASLVSQWSPVSAMAVARTDHGVLQLTSGDVLVAGGYTGAAHTTSCQRFRVTGSTVLAGGERQLAYSWVATASLPAGRSRHQLTPLGQYGGFALLTGGYDGAAQDEVYLYEESSDTWSTLAPLAAARYWHAAAPLGQFVVVTGGNNGAAMATTELYDAVATTWANGPNLNVARYRHTLTYYRADSVFGVVAGGLDAAGEPTPTTELYDFLGGAWVQVGKMTYARYGHRAFALPDGRLLVVGGLGRLANRPTDPVAPVALCEAFDPLRGSWEPWGSLPSATGLGVSRFSPPTPALSSPPFPNPGVLLAGLGSSSRTYSRGSSSGRWSPGPVPASSPLSAQGAGTDWFLACGGTVSGTPTTTAQLYVPASDTWADKAPAEAVAVWDAPDVNTVRVLDDGPPTTWTALEVRSGTEAGDWIGPYLFDPEGGFAVGGGFSTFTAQLLDAGQQYATLDVVAAPLELPEWVVLDFGGPLETGPLRVFGRNSPTQVRVDGSYVFPATIPAGTRIDGLVQKGPYAPEEVPGSLYVTASDKAAVFARDLVDQNAAGGLERDVQLRYPSGEGLGAEGWPTAGSGKLSDLPGVWSGE